MKRILCALMLVLTLTALLALPSSADVGNVDWGGGGGGGYDYGGGDWGGDYDYGGSYDYVGGYGDDSLSTSAGVILAVAIIVAALIIIKFKPTISSSGATVHTTLRQSGANNISAEQENAVAEQIRAVDPDFSAEEFRAYASDVILRVQEAWEARDWAVVRPYESDKLFAVHQRQLEEYIAQKKTNHMDEQYIQRVSLAAYSADGATETLTVRIDMSLCDYTTDDATGEIVSGVKNTKFVRAYRLDFIRSAGTKTVAGQTVKAHNCPNCGAPLDLNAAGRCAYCDSIVTSGEYGWVLNAYNKWS